MLLMTTISINIHCGPSLRTFRDQHLLGSWIGHGGPQACLRRSLYLNRVEDMACRNKVETQNALIRYIMEAPETILLFEVSLNKHIYSSG